MAIQASKETAVNIPRGKVRLSKNTHQKNEAQNAVTIPGMHNQNMCCLTTAGEATKTSLMSDEVINPADTAKTHFVFASRISERLGLDLASLSVSRNSHFKTYNIPSSSRRQAML